MSKFDIEGAVTRIIDTPAAASASPHHRLEHFRRVLREELRAAVLAGREEAAFVADHAATVEIRGSAIEVDEIRKFVGLGISAMIRTLPDP